MKLIERAKKFSHQAHDSIDQRRKYTQEPYWVHTDEVAEIVASVTDRPEIIVAAYLHDILEDVAPINSYYSATLIGDEFGLSVKELVIELTDVFTHNNYPQYNREIRKNMERERISKISSNAMTIKLADIISNTKSIMTHDIGFGRIYLNEIEKIVPHLKKGNSVLFHQALKEITHAQEKMNLLDSGIKL